MVPPVRSLLAASLAVLSLIASPAPGAVPHPVVPGFERLAAAGRTDTARAGQLLLGELGCVGCHEAGDKSAPRKQAPLLDGVGLRARPAYLRQFLRDPHGVKPGTAMPALFAGDPDADAKVEALVHFLATTGSFRQARPDAKLIAPGRDLYHKVGCVACHGSRDAAGNPDKTPPGCVPLGDLKAKWSLAGLAGFLEDPHRVRPAGRMPRILQGEQAKQVANYLLQGIRADGAAGKGTTNYAYYEGSWDKIPDFARLKPVARGVGPGFDLGVARRDHNFALRFEGFFKLDQDGEYGLRLHSDDGSRLEIDGKRLVDNDGIHPPSTASVAARLTKGVHRIAVDFLQGGGGAELEVTIDVPGLGRQDLADLVAPTEAALAKPAAAKKDEDHFEVRPDLAEKGRALFAAQGCAGCHRLTVGGKPVEATSLAPPLAKLKPGTGCLAAAPVRGLPWFALNDVQRKAITAALAKPPAPAKEPAEVIAQTLAAFNCLACHVRDKVGGPPEELNAFFQTTQPEMGDEGRVPPPLDGVGAKLRPEYLKQILDRGAHDRPYMHTRMPGFGLANVGPLAEALAAVDRLPAVPEVKFAEPLPRVKTQARHLLGDQALGCIKCHTFRGQKAEGVQGIDLTLMPQRLLRDWFHAYVAEPARLRPGTRMPAAFLNGKSVLPNVLDGTARTQIEAMWAYLSDPKARPPIGTLSRSIPLVPEKGAIIYRNFLDGVGPRGIAVGYPEKVHLAFDANELRLALLWQGAFLDAGRHWNDRGAGFEGPLGDNILSLHKGVPFALLARPDAPWPAAPAKEQGYRFLGYRLSGDDRPTFLYAVGDVQVEDLPGPVTGNDPVMRRTLTLTAPRPVDGLVFRAAVGDKVEPAAGGWFTIDGAWRLKVEAGATPQVRSAGGKKELLVPLRFADGKARLALEYAW